VTEGETDVLVPGFDPIHLPRALTVLFENGNRLVFDLDLARARDWIAADGTHLLYPKPYGNAIDLAELDEFGLPKPLPATVACPEPAGRGCREPHATPARQHLEPGS
jgi:hypothetical protein